MSGLVKWQLECQLTERKTARVPGVRSAWVVLGSANGSSNLGDEAMWRAAARVVRERFPEAEIITDGHPGFEPGVSGVTVLPYLYPELLRGRGLPRLLRSLVSRPDRDEHAAKRARRLLRGDPSPVLQLWDDAISRARGVVFSGAGAICDDYAPFGVHSWGILTRLAERHGVPVMFLGQGLGPLSRTANREAAAEMLRRAAGVTCRNATSRDLAIELGVDPARARPSPDWAVVSRITADERKAADIQLSRVGSSGFLAVSLHRRSPLTPTSYTRLAQLVSETADHLKYSNTAVVFVPNMRGKWFSDDCTTATRVLAKLDMGVRQRSQVLYESMSPGTTRAILARAQGLISSRYHPAAFAMAERVPTACLSLDHYYDLKMNGIAALNSVDPNAAVIPIREATADRIVRALTDTRPSGVSENECATAISDFESFLLGHHSDPMRSIRRP